MRIKRYVSVEAMFQEVRLAHGAYTLRNKTHRWNINVVHVPAQERDVKIDRQ